jgi:hypothetical protein
MFWQKYFKIAGLRHGHAMGSMAKFLFRVTCSPAMAVRLAMKQEYKMQLTKK